MESFGEWEQQTDSGFKMSNPTFCPHCKKDMEYFKLVFPPNSYLEITSWHSQVFVAFNIHIYLENMKRQFLFIFSKEADETKGNA